MSRSTHRTALVALVLAVVAALGLTGCGNSSGSSSSGTTQTLAVTVKGSTITPTNKRIQVAQGKAFTITITSDRTGELHVHSSPETHIEFSKGTTTKKLTFNTPGVIEVEEHASDTLVAQLEVK